MPELPEVETMRRGVAGVAGCTIRDFRRAPSRLQSIIIEPRPNVLRRRVVGRKIITVGRVGKRIVLGLDSGDRIVIEPRMSGLVILADPPDRGHLRVVFELSGPAKQLLFWDQRGLGVVRLVSAAEFDRLYGAEKIGPDALEISATVLRAASCVEPPGHQSGAVGPAGRGRHREYLRVGDATPCGHPSGEALQAAAAARMDAIARPNAQGPQRGDPPAGGDAARQYLPPCPR